MFGQEMGLDRGLVRRRRGGWGGGVVFVDQPLPARAHVMVDSERTDVDVLARRGEAQELDRSPDVRAEMKSRASGESLGSGSHETLL
jgi:hypothetical protein